MTLGQLFHVQININIQNIFKRTDGVFGTYRIASILLTFYHSLSRILMQRLTTIGLFYHAKNNDYVTNLRKRTDVN